MKKYEKLTKVFYFVAFVINKRLEKFFNLLAFLAKKCKNTIYLYF